MNILLAAGKYRPQAFGGVESSIHEMAVALQAAGHEVAILSGILTGDWHALKYRTLLKFSKSGFIKDDAYGYPVFRQWRLGGNLDRFLEMFRPDAVILHYGELVPVAKAFQARGVATLIYVHIASEYEFHGDPRTLVNTGFIANSTFTAGFMKEKYDVDACVIPPIFDRRRYVAKCRPRCVTYVNPTRKKGVDIALELARQCPDIPFQFIKSWVLEPGEEKHLRSAISQLRNVNLQNPTDDMRGIYANTKILLAPTLIQETWGRVATEAHFNAIPVLASNRGGLPEAVGPGGVLLDPDQPTLDWVAALRRFWDEPDYYDEISEAAKLWSERPALDPPHQVNSLENAILSLSNIS